MVWSEVCVLANVCVCQCLGPFSSIRLTEILSLTTLASWNNLLSGLIHTTHLHMTYWQCDDKDKERQEVEKERRKEVEEGKGLGKEKDTYG